MSFDFGRLENKYKTDSHFNAATNVFRNLIEKHGFLPDELREACFFAQYMYQMNRVERIIRSEKEWKDLAEMTYQMREFFVANYPAGLNALDDLENK